MRQIARQFGPIFRSHGKVYAKLLEKRRCKITVATVKND